MEQTKYYNSIHSTIGYFEEYLPIIASASVNYISFGPWGAAAGAALGSTDLLANYFEIYDKPYLTSTVLGIGIVNTLPLPYHLSTIIGGSLGLLAPTGLLGGYLITSPISSALYGYSYGGHYGAALGFACGALDEILHRYNVTSQYYASTIVKDIAITNLLLPLMPSRISNYLHTESLGVALGAIEAYTAAPPSKNNGSQ